MESMAIVYTRDQLLALREPSLFHGARHEIPKEIRRRRRGRRAGTHVKMNRRRFKPVVPAVIMGNVRSLANKTEELTTLMNTQTEYRECSLLSFTETWLHSHIPDSSVAVPGFTTVRADRDAASCGKKRGGGIALYVSERWCNPGHVCVKEQLCTPHVELLAVGLRPYYLPREFTSVVVVNVYVPLSADAEAAADVITTTVSRLQTQQPNSFCIITGDFNHITMDRTLGDFTQYVNCPTRGNKTLDLLYANAKKAYRATALPPLGRSDHNLVHLIPNYVPIAMRERVHKKAVRRWTPETEQALQDCLGSTDWDALCTPHGEDIDGMTDCITEYIKFCEESVMPTRTVRCFPNNKPWISCDLKNLLNRKKRAFRSGDREELKRVQHQLRDQLRNGRDSYRRKLESKLQQDNMRAVWSGMKKITGCGGRSRPITGSKERADELNTFFNRFSSLNASASSSPSLPL
ncbi:uncharacterized protein LOC144994953 [Oryzias latipes]